jgi:hypothetical protein
MTKNKKFNPQDWLNTEKPKAKKNTDIHKEKKQTPFFKTDFQSDVKDSIEKVVSQIEAQSLDITDGYENWLNLGFALSDELGESGREYFHRLSKFHPEYSYDACNKQYDNCLKSNNFGVTIRSLFYLAKQNGLTFSNKYNTEVGKDKPSFSNNPTIPNEVYQKLPVILKDSTDLFNDDIEKDVVLIGSLAVISACLPNVQGMYFNEYLTPHLYVFITAPAASGKGKMKWARYFGHKIQKTLLENSNSAKAQYELELEQFNNGPKKERTELPKPQEPKTKMFYIPANSSSSAFLKVLSDNDFNGVIFETEADTLANTLKQDWGNFSDVLRKAFHHEDSTMNRRKDNELLNVDNPHLAIALSGTPRQIHHMVPDVENGLFSRFLYYAFQDDGEFKNPFITNGKKDFQKIFLAKGDAIFDFYNLLSKEENPIVFNFTSEQEIDFTNRFKLMSKKNRLLLGSDFDANSKRLGVITFRIAMILTAHRIMETGEFTSTIVCSDKDFETAFSIVFTLEKHAISVFKISHRLI